MIPVIIIAHNQLVYIRNMVNQCLPITEKIYIIDSASTYKPLLNWYKNEVSQIKSVEIIYHPDNQGYIVWQNYIDRFPDEYIVTDPDLLFNPKMPPNAISILSDIGKKFNCSTVGLALDISDHQNFTNARFNDKSIYEWESQFWSNKIQSEPIEIYGAPVDTTFALRSKSRPGCALRVAGIFTCKHVPWYRRDKSPLPISDEEYAIHKQNSGSTNWRI